MTDTAIKILERKEYESGLTAPELVVYRFSEWNDKCGDFHLIYRTMKNRDEVIAICNRAAKQRYMGRKRYAWYALVK